MKYHDIKRHTNLPNEIEEYGDDRPLHPLLIAAGVCAIIVVGVLFCLQTGLL